MVEAKNLVKRVSKSHHLGVYFSEGRENEVVTTGIVKFKEAMSADAAMRIAAHLSTIL